MVVNGEVRVGARTRGCHRQSSVAKVLHNFGRAEHVDRDALARLVSSISRFLTPEQATALVTYEVADYSKGDFPTPQVFGATARDSPPPDHLYRTVGLSRRVLRRQPGRLRHGHGAAASNYSWLSRAVVQVHVARRPHAG